tara:strand:- start:21099 stop:21680 length:582 start_codon:yes stop_codon:yes gene_type:complete
MSCTIAIGKARYCKVQPGGIDKVYVINRFDAAAASTLTLDATTNILTATSGLTSFDGNAGAYFQFDTDPYLSALNQTIIVNEGGGVGFQQDIELVFKGVYAKADKTFQNLSNGTWQMVVEDNTGTLYFCGLQKGLICTGGSFGHNGDKALTDNQAYTLTFSCIELEPAANCATAVLFAAQDDVTISALQLDGA